MCVCMKINDYTCRMSKTAQKHLLLLLLLSGIVYISTGERIGVWVFVDTRTAYWECKMIYIYLPVTKLISGPFVHRKVYCTRLLRGMTYDLCIHTYTAVLCCACSKYCCTSYIIPLLLLLDGIYIHISYHVTRETTLNQLCKIETQNGCDGSLSYMV